MKQQKERVTKFFSVYKKKESFNNNTHTHSTFTPCGLEALLRKLKCLVRFYKKQ